MYSTKFLCAYVNSRNNVPGAHGMWVRAAFDGRYNQLWVDLAPGRPRPSPTYFQTPRFHLVKRPRPLAALDKMTRARCPIRANEAPGCFETWRGRLDEMQHTAERAGELSKGKCQVPHGYQCCVDWHQHVIILPQNQTNPRLLKTATDNQITKPFTRWHRLWS